MIAGIGTDIVQVARIARVLERTGMRFAEKILAVDELRQFHQYYFQRPTRAIRYLATRFAAKEAFFKALDASAQKLATWQGAQILNSPSGQPMALCTGELENYLHQSGMIVHVSLTDEAEYAAAFVLMEKP